MNILLIWVWPHSKRIYLPLIKFYEKEYNLKIKWTVDLYSKKVEIDWILNDYWYIWKKLYFQENELIFKDWQKYLNDAQIKELNKLIDEEKIDLVIISTEPLSHKTYALRALDNHLHILMDKPITTRYWISNDRNQALWLINDYNEIKNKYKEISWIKKIVFSCMSQRRYHWAYEKILSSISNVWKQTKVPVNNIIIQHSDWQRRFPNEIINEKYHWYNEWYGKCSHSWYHFFDMLSKIIETSSNSTWKHFDNIDIYSDFIYPKDLLKQISFKDYKKLFTDQSDYHNDYYYKLNKNNYWEIDANIHFVFKKWSKKITSASLCLLHNWYSERSWSKAKSDLYKWNWRVRHKTVIINQWPLQTIQYQSYQSKQIHKDNKKYSKIIWWEWHSKVYIFKNSWILWWTENFNEYDYSNINESALNWYSRWHQEYSRELCFLELINTISWKIEISSMKSSIMNHDLSVSLMAYSYQSAVQKKVINMYLNNK